MGVSIPQAVSAVATHGGISCYKNNSSVSIPQAVSAVATETYIMSKFANVVVSIPQAVSAVATAGSGKPVFMWFQKLVLENLKP